jgi:hypothetical protein
MTSLADRVCDPARRGGLCDLILHDLRASFEKK